MTQPAQHLPFRLARLVARFQDRYLCQLPSADLAGWTWPL